MKRAAALENSEQYGEAFREYAVVAENYPFSRYRKTAVRKAVFLNIRLGNEGINIKRAMRWLRVYLTLDLTPEEEESAQSLLLLLDRLNAVRIELARLKSKNERLLESAEKQSARLADCSRRIEELEKELALAREQFRKMKAVDLQMVGKTGLETRIRSVHGSGNETGTEHEAIVPDTLITIERNEEINPGDTEETVPAEKNMDRGGVPYQENDHVRAKKKEYYPYTIHVCSYKKKKRAEHSVKELGKKGFPAFTCLTHVPGKGNYYRVFVGYFKTLEAARKVVLNLRGFRDTYPLAVRMPYAVQVGTSGPQARLEKLKAELRSGSYLGYVMPDPVSPQKTRFLLGAFRTKKQAGDLVERLREQGYTAKVVRR